MSMATHSAEFRESPARLDFLGAVHAGWRAFLLGRRQRRDIVAVSRLPPHVIRDMGYDPEQIYYQLKGSWDELDPVTFRMLLPKDAHVGTDQAGHR